MEVNGDEELAELNCEEAWCFFRDNMEATTDKCIPKSVLTRNRWKQPNITHKTMEQSHTVRKGRVGESMRQRVTMIMTNMSRREINSTR